MTSLTGHRPAGAGKRSVGTLLSLAAAGPRQRGLVDVAGATAWDTCCRCQSRTNSSVGPLLLFLLKIGRLGAYVGTNRT